MQNLFADQDAGQLIDESVMGMDFYHLDPSEEKKELAPQSHLDNNDAKEFESTNSNDAGIDKDFREGHVSFSSEGDQDIVDIPEVKDKRNVFGHADQVSTRLDPKKEAKENQTLDAVYFYLQKNSWEYKGGRDNYKELYDSENSIFPWSAGLLFYYLFPEFFGHLGLGGGMSLSQNSGQGYFSNQDASDVQFNLWTLTLDSHFSYRLNLLKQFSLEVAAMPGFAILHEYRSDQQQNSNLKRVYTYSPGLSLLARANVDIGSIFPEASFEMMRLNSIEKFMLSFQVKYAQYKNFKKNSDIALSGLSFGIGLHFEYF